MVLLLDDALNTISGELETFFRLNLGGEGNSIVQENLVNHNGNPNPNTINKVVVSVVNMEEDRISRSQQNNRRQLDGSIARTKQEIRFNLYLLFIANCPSKQQDTHSAYNQGLRMLSGVIRFFQSKNVFTPQNTPNLPANVEKLIVEHYSLTLEQQNHLWGALGAKYLPSVLYKIRLFIFQEEPIQAGGPPISTIDIKSEDSTL